MWRRLRVPSAGRPTSANVCSAHHRSIAPLAAPSKFSSRLFCARSQGTIMNATMIYIGIGIGVNAISYFIPACKSDQS